MTADSRHAITEALQAAGWTDEDPAPGLLPKLRHPSGPVLTVISGDGGCALELGDGLSMTFLSGLPPAVVIAACLAAAGQLDQTPPSESARLSAEYEALSTVMSRLLAEATTATEINAVSRVGLRAGLLWRCHPCRQDHYLFQSVCSCGARRPAN
ncbi:hypothetical protein [Actinacidiphila sp. ITFR-21]|uniref:hypothetical protein n=1 Tax=Actinacidiphila sp. ITFR-21 TaxID=3075199 RepID=UPI00288B5B80|nr:hypothetical protein [Streptomyces sp. ITFR-21]WNI20342.1 hypothetical protein RLT57_32585 [Streptomyces sp. ITFR-21]